MNIPFRKEIKELLDEIEEIVKILTAIVKKANPRILS